MANMSYCRFENTLADLKDCRNALQEEGFDSLSESEKHAARRLFAVCHEIMDWKEQNPID